MRSIDKILNENRSIIYITLLKENNVKMNLKDNGF